MMNRDQYIEVLKQGEVVVHFKKKSGEDRLMLCTLEPSRILSGNKDPADLNGATPVNEEVVPVWDLMANGWRAFRVDSVKGLYKRETG